MYRSFSVCLCFVLSCFVLGHGPLYGEEIKPADSAQPAAAEAPPHLEEAEAADEAAMQSLVVRIDSPLERAGETQVWAWAVTVILNNDGDETAQPTSGEQIKLRMQVPNISLGESGTLTQVVVRAIETAEQEPLWEVIGLPEAVAVRDGGDMSAFPNPDDFARKLANMLRGWPSPNQRYPCAPPPR